MKASVKKSLEKEKASQKIRESVALADAPAPELCDEYKAIYNKDTFVKETAKNNKREAAATEMFLLNL
jgi:hypothetical protein